MTNIVNLENWVGNLEKVYANISIPSLFFDPCPVVNEIYDSIMNNTADNVSAPNTVHFKNLSYNFDIDLDTIAKSEAVVAYQNTLNNVDSTVDQTISTPSFERDITQSTTHTTETGWSFTGSESIEVKGSVSIPFVADGSITSTTTFSTTYDTKSTDSVTTSTSTKMTIPSQNIQVPKGHIAEVSILLAKIIIPETNITFTGELDGYLKIAWGESYRTLNIYDMVKEINDRCPNSYVNVDNKITLNDINKTIKVTGFGNFNADLMVYDFYLKTNIYKPNRELVETIVKPIHVVRKN